MNMSRDESSWQNYLLWNDAILNVVYPEREIATPVYLDLDDETLSSIAEQANFLGDPKVGLCDAVAQIVKFGSQFSLVPIFNAHRDWLRSIRKPDHLRHTIEEPSRLSNPPAVAFLAVATLAALDMGKDDLIAIAYYPRVADLLKLPRDEKSIQRQFHDYSEVLWRELNFWIESQEGRVGLPTAYSLSQRFVGIPQSQALVRKADRQKLPEFFSQFGLDPRADVSAETMAVFLGAWFASEVCNASDALQRLWKIPATHERIAEIVALELSGWDGTLPRGSRLVSGSYSQVRLMASLQQNFIGNSFSLALTYRHVGNEIMNRDMEVESIGGEWMPIAFQPLASNLYYTSNSHGLNIATVLEGSVNLRLADGDGQVSKRFPRTVVPLVLDEIHGGYMEQSTLQLNVESVLLVRDSSDSLDKVREVLSEYARPGYKEEQFPELPAEWVAFVGVQLFGVPPKTRFKELQPISRSQLTIAGGVRIPSSVRKWTILAPPEIRVAIADCEKFEVVVSDAYSGDEIFRESSTTGALITSLADLTLDPGDYRATVYIGRSKEPSYQSTIRLRSADEVDARWHLVERLAYQMNSEKAALGAISAQIEESIEATSVVDGAFANGDFGISSTESVSAKPTWATQPEVINSPPASQVRIAAVSADSCVYTGAHKMQIDTVLGAKPGRFQKGLFQRGECKNCHIVKQYPRWPKAAKLPRLGNDTVAEDSNFSVEVLSSVQPTSQNLWDAAVDSLMHLGGGSGSALNSLAVQIDNNSIFAFDFANALEQLGYLELQREMDGSVIGWEVSPTCITGMPNGEWNLVGYWPPKMIDELTSSITNLGGKIHMQKNERQPTRVILQNVTAENLESVSPGEVIHSAGLTMLSSLPRLSRVGKALPRKPMPGFIKAEYFDVDAARWVEVQNISRVGSFRLRRDFRSEYIHRDQDDLDHDTVARGTPYLVKYLAGQIEGKSLLSYKKDSKSLLVPFGVELPGLYGRAIVLMSGRRAGNVKISMDGVTRNCNEYHDVEEDAANMLLTLLLT